MRKPSDWIEQNNWYREKFNESRMILIKFMVGTFVVYCGVFICKWLSGFPLEGNVCGVEEMYVMIWNKFSGFEVCRLTFVVKWFKGKFRYELWKQIKSFVTSFVMEIEVDIWFIIVIWKIVEQFNYIFVFNEKFEVN